MAVSETPNYLHKLPKELNNLLIDGFKKVYVLYSLGCFSDYGIMGISYNLNDAIILMLQLYDYIRLEVPKNSYNFIYSLNEYNKEKNQWKYAVEDPDRKIHKSTIIPHRSYFIVEYPFNEPLWNGAKGRSNVIFIQYRFEEGKIVKYYTYSGVDPENFIDEIKSWQKDNDRLVKENGHHGILFKDEEFILGPCPPLDSFDFKKVEFTANSNET